MTSAHAALQKAADDGSLDDALWPDTLQYILDRLDELIHDFPKPPADTSTADTTHTAVTTHTTLTADTTHSTDTTDITTTTPNKENAPPTTPPRPPPVPIFAAPESTTLPPATTTFYSSIRNALSTNFAKHPPHTIQRLAELILEPKRRYKYLSPYLRALDRVVSVSSPLTIFPLPQALLPTTGGLLNGTTSAPNPNLNPAAATLGSDESLGGALLTPIPWLHNRGQNELISESTEMVDGPNGTGRIETVTVGMLTAQAARQETAAAASQVSHIASSHPDGETLPSTGPVTQGELLRQEQQAGIVLNNPHSITTSPTRSTFGQVEGGGSVLETVEGEEEAPHARGPDTIGMEDTGPQKHAAPLDIEGAIGRPSLERSSRSPGPAADAHAHIDENMQDAEDKNDDKNDANNDKNDDDKAAEEQLRTEVAEQEKESGVKDVEMK